VYISRVLTGEDIAFRATADGVWAVYFGPLVLGHYDERRGPTTNLAPVSRVAAMSLDRSVRDVSSHYCAGSVRMDCGRCEQAAPGRCDISAIFLDADHCAF
jgi:hypothetical protein